MKPQITANEAIKTEEAIALQRSCGMKPQITSTFRFRRRSSTRFKGAAA